MQLNKFQISTLPYISSVFSVLQNILTPIMDEETPLLNPAVQQISDLPRNNRSCRNQIIGSILALVVSYHRLPITIRVC